MHTVWPRALALLLATLCCTALAPAAAAATDTATTETLHLPGLLAPALIVVDTWGVPHIYARSEDDVFFVQGFNAARDRLFQIDLWRRRGLGKLASVFGAQFVEQDRAARLFLYRGDMRHEWQAYGPHAQRIASRFVAGINAFIDLARNDRARLPFEFGHFGYAPEKWHADDVVRIRSHGLTRNLSSEVLRAWLACRGQPEFDALRSPLSPPWHTQMPEGLDPCIAPGVLRTFDLGTKDVVVGARDGPRGTTDEALEFARAAVDAQTQGSNAWVVSPARSATGRPILASDPHRLHSAPSLRYLVHLSAPGLDVIGGGEPALPGISIGHNGTVAFGLTIFSIDQEDLYVYETRPDDARQYRYRGRWEQMRVLAESIEVRDQAPQRVELLFTRHGPVLHVDAANRRAYALRSGWFEPGMAPYFGSVHYMRAKSFAEFKRAMANWGAPAENQLYADVAGNIGWVAGGLAPIRPNWDGLWPVPGNGRFEWTGFWSGAQLPSLLNPEPGWFASANEQNLPAAFAYRERKLGFEWPPRSRHQRLAEVLSTTRKMSIDDSMRLQNDVLSLPARRLQPLLRALKPTDARAKAAVALLADWNLQVAGDAPAAALFEVWWSRHLGPALKQALLPAFAAAVIAVPHEDALLAALENPRERWSADATARRDQVLEKSLAAAWDDMQQLGGADSAQWRWDALHHSHFMHPMAHAVDAATRSRLNVGPMPKQGSSETVNLSSFDPRSFRQLAGPSLRLVLDVGQWDDSRAVNAPGQSGDPASPHYRDLAALWLRGDYFPLLYSRAKIEAAASRRISLLPGR